MNNRTMKTLPEIHEAVQSPASFCRCRRRKGETNHHYRMRWITKALSKIKPQSREDQLLSFFRRELLGK